MSCVSSVELLKSIFFIFLDILDYKAISLTADKYAKDTAYRVFTGEIAASINVSINTAFSVAGEIAKKSWQRLWGHEHSGRYNYNLIPVVNSKLLFPLQHDIGISYCRLLLHDSMHSPMCDCGLEKETSEHFLLRCSMYGSVRDNMFEQLSQICIKNNKMLQITESLLLAPQCEDINKSQNRIIKELLFQYQPSDMNQHYLFLPCCYILLENSLQRFKLCSLHNRCQHKDETLCVLYTVCNFVCFCLFVHQIKPLNGFAPNSH